MNTAIRVRGVGPRPLSVFASIVCLVVLGTAPALAYDWCSRDPVLTFARGLLPEHVLDVQVAVRGGPISFADVDVALDVTVPANVRGHDALALVTEPAFRVYTTFHPALAPASSKSYNVLLDAYVPATHGSFDTALVITGVPLDGFEAGNLHVACAGRTGSTTHAKVSFAPLKVYCKQATGWVLAFG